MIEEETKKQFKNKPVVVESEIKRIIRDEGMNKEESLAIILDAKVRQEIREAIRRAKLNGRRTVMIRDL